MELINCIKRYIAEERAKMRKREIEYCFVGIVHNCCKVSANNHNLSYVVYKSVQGYPRVESIDRPEVVELSELDNCVIVKDGYVYELTKRAE